MGPNLYQVSLAAAFVAGMVALFAPCCISFLLPAYFGNVFRERRRVILMTFVYALGIFTVMLPVVLGAKALSLFFFRFHDQSYLTSGIFLILISGLTLLGIKLPMPHINLTRQGEKLDVWSTYTLGIVSGVTSACCAPVLLGVMSLSTLTATVGGAVAVGAMYVGGMVFPLFVASWFLERGNILEKPLWRKRMGEVKILGKEYLILVGNVVGAVIFGILGITIVYLAMTGGLGMPEANPAITQVAESLTQMTKGIAWTDVILVVALGAIAGKLVGRKWIIGAVIGLVFGLGWLMLNSRLVSGEYRDLSAREFLDKLKGEEVFLVDVHMPEQEHLVETDAVIPFDQVERRLNEFPQDKNVQILVYCRSGSMSAMAAEDLVTAGYKNVYNLNGGMHAWTGAGLPLDWR